jgi:hypothetical protein
MSYNIMICYDICRGVEPRPSFQNENHPCVERDLRRQYRTEMGDGLWVEQSQSQVNKRVPFTSEVSVDICEVR